MSTTAQVVVVIITATVFLIRLVIALYQAHDDGQTAARHAHRDRQP